jgi:hypothetical protein
MINPLKRLQARIELKRDYMETFSTEHGKRVLADILAQAGVTRPRFDADPGVTQFWEGHRHLAMSIYRQVHSSMDALTDLLSEEQKRTDDNHKEHAQ